MTKSTIKELAKNAKKRLTNCDYDSKPQKVSNIIEFVPKKINQSQIQINKLVTSDEKVLKAKILDLLEYDFYSQNPIAKLIDYNYFNKLSDELKQKYILEISNFYTETRSDFLRQKLKKYS